jgi:hypothetical protein
MPRLNESTIPSSEEDSNPPHGFEDFAKSLLISEIRAMIRRLQEAGEFQIPAVQLEDLDLRRLKYLKRELRDTLRSLGGGR